jgi:hypothetical protein
LILAIKSCEKMADELMKGMSQISIDDYNENIGISFFCNAFHD